MSKSTRCFYSNDIVSFLMDDNESVLGELCNKYWGNLSSTQVDAWTKEIEILKPVLTPWKSKNDHIIFEYDIPRLGKRIDIVLLLNGIIFCIEFKAGKSKYEQNDIDQVMDYALDLKNFHKYSQDNLIVPILVATESETSSSLIQLSVYDDRVINPLVTGEHNLSKLMSKVLDRYPNERPINENWIISPYSPILIRIY